MPNQEILAENRCIHQVHVQAWKKSGKPLNQYAREHGINPRTFYDWCKKYGVSQNSLPPKFEGGQKVELVAVPSHVISPVQIPAMSDKSLSIYYGEKFRIVVTPEFSPALLGRVVQTLERIR